MGWRIAVAAVVLAAALMAGCAAGPVARPEDEKLGGPSETTHTVGARLSDLRIDLSVPKGALAPRERHVAVISVLNVGNSTVFAPFYDLQAFDSAGHPSSDWYSSSGMAGRRPAAFALTRLVPGAVDMQQRWFELPHAGLYTLRLLPIAGTTPPGVLPTMTVEAR